MNKCECRVCEEVQAEKVGYFTLPDMRESEMCSCMNGQNITMIDVHGCCTSCGKIVWAELGDKVQLQDEPEINKLNPPKKVLRTWQQICEEEDAEAIGTHETGAQKHSAIKIRYDLIPVEPLEELAKVYTWSCIEKYPAENWRKGLPYKSIYRAILSHTFKWFCGEKNDSESGLHHLAHAMWNCITLIWYDKFKPELDDRELEHTGNTNDSMGNFSGNKTNDSEET